MFNERIKQLREEQGLPLRKVAAALDADTASYYKIEKGGRKARKKYISVIAEFLKGDYEELIDQYQEDDRYNRPWIIGFSGGKDSTVLLTLVWLALLKIRENNPAVTLKRQVYVICNDTMVENPVIEEYVTTVLQTIQKVAKEQQLPITVKTTIPQIEDTFCAA